MSASASGPTASETSLTRDIGKYLIYQLRGRRAVIVGAVVLGAPALWFGWPWLVMAGLAPLILAMAPCAVMCAVGACAMGKSRKKSEAASAPSSPAADAALEQAPAAPTLLTSISSEPGRDSERQLG